MTEQKPRRKRRTKANIVASIDSAAVAEISQNGFVSALVTNIIKNAQIEPQVFYNRYKDINEFYDSFVRKYENCLQDVLKDINEPIISKQGVSDILKEILSIINEDPVSLELLRWEVCEKNKTTMRTALLRELNFQPLIQGFIRSFKGSGIDIIGIFTILVGGIYYTSLHKKLSPYYGIDLNTPEGIEQIGNAAKYLISLVFDARNKANRENEIAESLRAQGVHEDIITKAIGKSAYPQNNTKIKPTSEPLNAADKQ